MINDCAAFGSREVNCHASPSPGRSRPPCGLVLHERPGITAIAVAANRGTVVRGGRMRGSARRARRAAAGEAGRALTPFPSGSLMRPFAAPARLMLRNDSEGDKTNGIVQLQANG